jgi:hypothetical protein
MSGPVVNPGAPVTPLLPINTGTPEPTAFVAVILAVKKNPSSSELGVKVEEVAPEIGAHK